MAKHPYVKLLAMAALSFLSMYALMYAMVAQWDHVEMSVSRGYMAALMTAPMVAFGLVIMGGMYPDKRLNGALLAAALFALVAFWMALRSQAGIGDVQFLKGMIPHHSGAIRMCGQATLTDPEVRELCKAIVESQQREIEQMKGILARMDR